MREIYFDAKIKSGRKQNLNFEEVSDYEKENLMFCGCGFNAYGSYGVGKYNAYLFFAADGGKSVEFVKVPCGTTVNLNEYVPEKIGYEFEGWYDSPVDTANRLGEITVWDNTVVCAKWKLAEGTSERLLELDILSRDVVGNNVVFQTVDNEVKIVPVTDLWVEQNARLEALMKTNNELYNR